MTPRPTWMPALFVPAALTALAACSRATDTPPPKATAEPALDAGAADAAVATVAPAVRRDVAPTPPSPFGVVARAPTLRRQPPLREVAAALPLVQRLPGGGLVVASEYARASAEGPGPLRVELVTGKPLESSILYRHGDVQGAEGLRWTFSDPTLTVISREEATMRSGARLESYRLRGSGLELTSGHSGYLGAVVRDGSVLALERVAYEIPDSSLYPKGTEYAQNVWGIRPARVAVLRGSGPAPSIPAGLCPTTMSAAPDGTLAIVVERCGEGVRDVGVLRYAPRATTAKVEWLAGPRPPQGESEDEMAAFAASAGELWVSDGPRLSRWDGKAWSSSTPFDRKQITSISRGADGALWVSVGGELRKRAPGQETWATVSLPTPPDDALDPDLWSPPGLSEGERDFVRASEPRFGDQLRDSAKTMSAMSVDATGEDVLVLATVDREAFVLSTKPRGEVARLPSIPVQRARLAMAMKREPAASAKKCWDTFLVFPEGTKPEAVKAIADVDSGTGARVGEGIVEGKKRLVVYGYEWDRDRPGAASTPFKALAPTVMCGPAVVEKPL